MKQTCWPMTALDWLKQAKREGCAIGAVNAGNLETLKASAAAAADSRSPVIIESSPGETVWIGARNLVDLVRNHTEQYGVPILLNLDHALTFEACAGAIEPATILSISTARRCRSTKTWLSPAGSPSSQAPKGSAPRVSWTISAARRRSTRMRQQMARLLPG